MAETSKVLITEPHRGMKVAVVGCSHGELDKMYETIQLIEHKTNSKIDLLLCCGDFQAVRNEADLACLACPPKYRDMRTFYKYYSGEKKAPILTLYIAGNHEASNYHLELFHGGWVAPNIYFMGYANMLTFGGLRIGGLSGIFKSNHFQLGHYEGPPYTDSSMRSAYHVREYELFKLRQVTRPVDIFLSHDWPAGIAHHGDKQALLRKKKFLADEVNNNSLGSPAGQTLVNILQPAYWFSAHLHVKFAAAIKHESGRTSRFLALDKCLPHRDFMQVIDFPDATGPRCLQYDDEWLAIVRSTEPLLSLEHARQTLPSIRTSSIRFDYRPTETEMRELHERLRARARGTGGEVNASMATTAETKTAAGSDDGMDLTVPLNFEITAPVFVPHASGRFNKSAPQPDFCVNPQTTAFLDMLGLPDRIAERFRSQTTGAHAAAPMLSVSTALPVAPPVRSIPAVHDPDEIDIGLDDSVVPSPAAPNPEEIDIGDL